MTVGFAYRDRVFAVRIGPWRALAIGIALVLFGAWYAAATLYLVYRDKLVDSGAAREAELAAGYEDRIASLTAEIQRLRSRQLVAQSTVASRIEAIMAKQSEIERKHEAVSRLLISRSGPASKAESVTAPLPAPRAELRRHTNSDAELAPSATGSAPAGSAELSEVALRLAQIERDQFEALQTLDTGARRSIGRLRETLVSLGIAPAVAPAKATAFASDGAGGPFIPVDGLDPGWFETKLRTVERAFAALDLLREKGRKLPLLSPVGAAADVTSNFGPRIDPFLRRPALHTGIDFRTAHGQPVAATAAGVVITAEYSGGYGQMVEIDHGHGVVTRYAHLSSIAVPAGRRVNPGTIIGYAGSTGRSTATHLHYETRIDGEPIDPMKFIAAGAKIAPLLK